MELNKIFDYMSHYYANTLGYMPEKDVWRPTFLSIWYMEINGLSNDEILKELKRHTSSEICVDNLSDELWKGSLTQKNKFYFHHALQIVSPAPVFSIKTGASYTEDWCVPRIRFTEQDLTDYFWHKISPTEQKMWILGHDMGKEIAYLLNRFKHSFSDIDPLDYLMFLLDELIRDQNKQHIKGLISVTDYISNTLETYQNTILEAKAKGFDKPRWPVCI